MPVVLKKLWHLPLRDAALLVQAAAFLFTTECRFALGAPPRGHSPLAFPETTPRG